MDKAVLRPSHTGPDNENENENDKNARPRLVEMLHAEYAHAHSTNRGRAFLSFSFSLSGPVWLGLYIDKCHLWEKSLNMLRERGTKAMTKGMKAMAPTW